ncbi:MAG: dihydroxy-acid dehydratase, partial [bacterium]|nr:dihydroxy-acid dehydratase [bacterium]
MKTRDPLLNQPEPVTLFLPVVEALLKKNGCSAKREEIVRCFYQARPRIAIISGSEDHPAHIYDDILIRCLVRDIWSQKGIPFVFKVPSLCDGMAQGHKGMEYSLASRDLTAEIVTGQIIGHHYDAAIFLSGCDKNPAGFLAAALKTNRVYKKEFGKNFIFLFLNTPVMKDIPLPASLKKIMPASEALQALFPETLKCNVYAKYFKVLSGLEKKGRAKESARILRSLAPYVCTTGGTCAFMGTGNTSKFILYSLGLVPDEYALPVLKDYVNPNASRRVTDLLFRLIRNKKDISRIVVENFENSLHVLGCINGSLNWILHFRYLSGLTGYVKDIIHSVHDRPVLIPADR